MHYFLQVFAVKVLYLKLENVNIEYIFAISHFVELQNIVENGLHSEEIINFFIKFNPELFSKGTVTDITCELSIHSLLNDDG